MRRTAALTMSKTEPAEITRLLAQPGAAVAVFPLVYEELRAIARRRLRTERAGHTLQPTALVNEVALRLLGKSSASWNDRAHFFAAAAEAMRHILIEHARDRGRQKRGGGKKRKQLSLDAAELLADVDGGEILMVDEAVRRLEQQDPALAQLVKLRFFAGLTSEQIADAMGTSESTVRRDWKLAKAWLVRELGSP
jgi:RNA polymerase sigma factor (TIGR02999 family)